MAAPVPPSTLPSAAQSIDRDIRKTGIHPDYWYPVAQSKQVQLGKAIGVTFAGEPIVLVRTLSGKLFALPDRCAHRQVPLHSGVVNEDCIQCGYHGWTYDSSGQCINVPYLSTDQGRPKGVGNYPCREAAGLIFVFPGDPTQQETVPFPDLSRHDDPTYKTRYLSRRVACHYSFLHENLMDMNHQFLHRRLMGGIRSVYLDLRQGENWIEVDYTFRRYKGKQNLGEKFILQRSPPPSSSSGKKAKDLMTIRTEYPYQYLQFWTAGSENPALDLWIVYVPLDKAQRTNHTYGLMMIRKPNIPGLMELLWPFIVYFTEGIFKEDQFIVEEEQKAFDRQGADWNQEIFPVICSLRKILVGQGIDLGMTS